jgi:hypothetical protein
MRADVLERESVSNRIIAMIAKLRTQVLESEPTGLLSYLGVKHQVAIC